MKNISIKFACITCALLASHSVWANEQPVHEFTANVGAVSKYIYRGGVEHDDVAIQGGIDYAHQSGLFAGYWGSTLDYDPTDENKDSGFEHDFYVGYGRSLNDDWSYSSQVVAYVYQNGGTVYADADERRSTAFELINNLTYRDFSLDMGVMLADASFANAGDVYLSASYQYALPQDFYLNTSAGWTIYNDGRDDAIVATTEDAVFSEARLGFSKSIANTGAEFSLDYIWGGKNRIGESFDDQTVLGFTYHF